MLKESFKRSQVDRVLLLLSKPHCFSIIFGQGILAAFNLLKLKCSRYIVPRELSCKDGLSKGQSGTDLAEAEEIKKK